MFDSDRFWTRRDFLKIVGQTGVISAVPTLAHAAAMLDPERVTISILHTTDLHGHILPTSEYDQAPGLGGLARCVTQIRKWRRKNPNTLLIDVGDVYQGTEVGLRTRGQLMIDLFNHLKYDAWVVGNHEFDWGTGPFLTALQRSAMPVLSANLILQDKCAGEISDPANPFSRIQPYLLKDIGGIRIAVIGLTTPGMRFWFRPDFIHDLEFGYPIEPVRRAIVKAKSEGANAIVIAGHMGFKARSRGDDFANSVMALTTEFPDISTFIAGHTHQLVSSRLANNVLVTQADHFGIHVGRVDLSFDRNSKRLLRRQAHCELMDDRFRLDHIVISRAQPHLAQSAALLAEPIGELAETFRVRARPGQPSDVERLIGSAILESLRRRGISVDAAFHGVFDDEHDLAAGTKTINDVWRILPYENYLVTAELTFDELKVVMEETYVTRENRSLIGLEMVTEGNGAERRVSSINMVNGLPLERGKKYTIAFNTFDSRSAGHKFMKLRALLEQPAANCTFHNVQTRDALLDYFRKHRRVQRVTTQQHLAAAA